jgi:hypothetical protein
VRLETYKGVVHADLARFAESRFETYKGEIEIALPKAASFDLDADLGHRGNLDSDFPMAVRFFGRRRAASEHGRRRRAASRARDLQGQLPPPRKVNRRRLPSSNPAEVDAMKNSRTRLTAAAAALFGLALLPSPARADGRIHKRQEHQQQRIARASGAASSRRARPRGSSGAKGG